MSHSSTQQPGNPKPTFPLAGILAQAGTAQAGAVVQRTRVAAPPVNPVITPASPIIVVVKKPHTNPARVPITLKTSANFHRSGTLTRIMTPTSGNIRLFDAPKAGKEITFTQVDPLKPAESEHVFSANELSAGVHLFAESDSPCSNLDDYRLRLTLLKGPTPVGPPQEVILTAVLLSLDISPPRTAPGAPLTPLPQPPATPPGPGATDKWFGGLPLNAQDPGSNQQRAQLLVGQVIPTAFAGDLVLRQVRVSGNNITGADNKVQIFDDETPGPKQIPPITETPKPNPFEFNASTASFPGRQFFVEGKAASTALRDTGFQLGIKGVENDGDRVAITVAVAPVLSMDSPFVVMKKPHTKPARRIVTLSTSVASARSGKLTKSGAGPVKIFKTVAGTTEMAFDDKQNVFNGTQLGAGVQVFAESTAPSASAEDFQLTLTLNPDALPAGQPAVIKMTAVEITLDIAQSRTSPSVTPPVLSSTDKIDPGRVLIVQDASFSHERAMVLVRPPNPNVPLTLRLASSALAQGFAIENPAAGQVPIANPNLIPSFILPATGSQFFAEGKAPGSALRDTTFTLGIDGLENDADHVAITVFPDPSLPGPFAVGEREYTRPATLSIAARTETLYELTLADPGFAGAPASQPTGAFSAKIHGLVRYPASVAGVDKPVSAVLPKYPLVVIAHGNHGVVDSLGTPVESFRGLEYLARHLASYGYIALSIDLDVANTSALGFIFPGIEQRGLVILEHIDFWKSLNTSDPLFTGKVDLAQIGLIGHSRGGEAVVSAQDINIKDARGFDIKAVTSISQTDFLGITHSTTPYLVVYGSADGDVSLGWPFRMYDRAAAFKALVFVYGAIHNRFSTSADWLARLDPDPAPAGMVSEPDHLNIAKGYCLAFLQLMLRGVGDHMSLFKNNGRLSTVSGGVEIFQQVQDKPPRLAVDNFEQGAFNPALPQGPQLVARAAKNTLGQTVTQSGLAVPSAPLTNALTEASLRHRDLNLALSNDFFWNDTFGEMLAWDTAGGSYTQPLGTQDVSSFQVLSFRVTQRLGSPRNPNPPGLTPGTSPDFSVELVDSAGKTARVRVGSIATIPFPWKREDNIRNSAGVVVGTTKQFSKSALTTIRIPLSAFTSVNSTLNLSSLKAVVFQFDLTPKAEIAIADLEFSN